jgi:hypothetical protein
VSHDVRIWSIAPCPDAAAHRAEGKGWQLVVTASEPVLDEDVPDEILPLLPGIGHLTELHLEGERSKAAIAALTKATKAIATATTGVIEDPQDASVTLPSGVKRWTPPARADRVELLELTWWLAQPALLERTTLERFVALLASRLPEAMPRRYGAYEPPEHQLARTGHAHLLDYLASHLAGTVVWYPSPPVAYLGIGHHRDPAWSQRGGRPVFRAHYVTFSIERDVLKQPGWASALRRAWRELSALLQPFYGDVRTTRGHLRSRNGGWSSDGTTEQHPVRAWWWGGIPPRLGHAAVVGSPYLERWPELAGHGTRDGGLLHLSTSDWLAGDDVADAVGGVPARIAMINPGSYPEQYPSEFPFPRP